MVESIERPIDGGFSDGKQGIERVPKSSVVLLVRQVPRKHQILEEHGELKCAQAKCGGYLLP